MTRTEMLESEVLLLRGVNNKLKESNINLQNKMHSIHTYYGALIDILVGIVGATPAEVRESKKSAKEKAREIIRKEEEMYEDNKTEDDEI